MLHSTARIVLFMLLGGMGARVDAQSPIELSLEEAIRRAESTAPRLAEARAREATAASVVDSRAALGGPSVDVQAGFLRTNHVEEFGLPQAGGGERIVFPDIPSNYRTRAEVSIPIFTGGRLPALVDAARTDRDATQAESAVTRADIVLETTQVYFALVTTRGRAEVLRRALERADASVEDVRARLNVGLLPPSDLLSAEAQRASQRVQSFEARRAAALAEMELARLIGAAAVELLTMAPTVLTERAASVRPERRALLLRGAAFEATARAHGAERWPQLAALAAVESSRPNPRFAPRTDTGRESWDLGVTVTWNIWDSGRRRADEATASAQAQVIRARVDEFDARLAVEVRERLLTIESAREALAAAVEGVAAATEARRVVVERFGAGVTTSTEVLDADLRQLEAELDVTRLAAALRMGEARLARSVGVDR
jgi:outer membrane protein TolC